MKRAKRKKKNVARFETIVSPNARDGIKKIIRSAETSTQPDFNPHATCNTHLCKNGTRPSTTPKLHLTRRDLC